MGKKKYCTIYLCLLMIFCVDAQQKIIDSLELQLKHPTNGLSTVEVLNELSWYYAFSSPDNGIDTAEKAINLAIIKNDSLKLGIAYERKAFNLEKLGKDSMVLVSYKYAEKIYDQIHHKKRLGALAFNLANFHLHRSNYENSIAYSQKALDIFKSNGDTLKTVRVYNQISLNQIYLGNYTYALDTFQKGMLLLELSHNEESIYYAELLGNMGLLYEKLSEYKTALQYQKQALQIHNKNGNTQGVANSYNNLGKLYGLLEQHNKALEMFNFSYDIKKKMNNKYRIANVLTNIGLSYHALNQFDNALQQFELTKSIYKDLNHNSNLSIVYRNIGDVQLDMGQFSEAIKSFDLAVMNAIKAKDKRAIYLSKDKLAKANSKISNYEIAYQMQKEAQSLKDSLFSDENINKIADLKATYKYEKEKALLEAEFARKKVLDQLKIKQQTFKKNVSIGVGVFSLIFVAIGFALYRRKTEADLNSKIVSSELQKLKAQMNPHFIFNTLNSINDYVLKNDKNTASHYLVKFSNIMRRILENSNEEEVTLQEEIDFLDTYMNLEQQRLTNSFDYTISIEEDINPEETLIPPSLIQPFIENSIWHGFSTKKTGGQLNLKFSLEEQTLICIVDDNGVGMNTNIDKSANKKSFGTGSVKERIGLLNKIKGLNTKIEFIHKEQGVCVVIKLPLLLDN